MLNMMAICKQPDDTRQETSRLLQHTRSWLENPHLTERIIGAKRRCGVAIRDQAEVDRAFSG